MKTPIQQMIDRIDDAIGQTRNVPEIDVMTALVEMAEGWRMRLQELEDEQNADEP